ncbi:MAG: hypothetical protein NTY66_00265 [Candidatus Vogelbacteria bacterium]|nr:hypothetical protein [Candidatus Vogelbacteria bacterium]
MDSKTLAQTRTLTEKMEGLEKIQRETALWLRQSPEAKSAVIRVAFASICRRNGHTPGSELAQLLTLPAQDKTRLLTAIDETKP